MLLLQIMSFLMFVFAVFSHGYLHSHEEVTHAFTVKKKNSNIYKALYCVCIYISVCCEVVRAYM